MQLFIKIIILVILLVIILNLIFGVSIENYDNFYGEKWDPRWDPWWIITKGMTPNLRGRRELPRVDVNLQNLSFYTPISDDL